MRSPQTFIEMRGRRDGQRYATLQMNAIILSPCYLRSQHVKTALDADMYNV